MYEYNFNKNNSQISKNEPFLPNYIEQKASFHFTRIVQNEEIKQEGTKFVANLLKDENAVKAAVILLRNVMRDEQFRKEGQEFVNQMIVSAAKTTLVEENV